MLPTAVLATSVRNSGARTAGPSWCKVQPYLTVEVCATPEPADFRSQQRASVRPPLGQIPQPEKNHRTYSS